MKQPQRTFRVCCHSRRRLQQQGLAGVLLYVQPSAARKPQAVMAAPRDLRAGLSGTKKTFKLNDTPHDPVWCCAVLLLLLPQLQCLLPPTHVPPPSTGSPLRLKLVRMWS